MDFGKVSSDLLDSIDFTLPPDPPENAAILAKGKKKAKVYVGCAKWGRKDWVGQIYPPKTKEADYLKLYGREFNCVELNATFYRMPDAAQIRKWKSMVEPDFKFSPKFVDVITHLRRLKDTKPLTDIFLDAVANFEENLGPLFLLPHPQIGPKHLPQVENFLHELPKGVDVAMELRHPDWYTPENSEVIFSLMRKLKTGSIITDASGRRDCVHMHLTTPHAFIRFVGNGLHPTDYQRIDDWVQRIGQWLEQGLETCYFFMHQHDELHSPMLCRYVIEQLNKHHRLDIPMPQFISDNQLL